MARTVPNKLTSLEHRTSDIDGPSSEESVKMVPQQKEAEL